MHAEYRRAVKLCLRTWTTLVTLLLANAGMYTGGKYKGGIESGQLELQLQRSKGDNERWDGINALHDYYMTA